MSLFGSDNDSDGQEFPDPIEEADISDGSADQDGFSGTFRHLIYFVAFFNLLVISRLIFFNLHVSRRRLRVGRGQLRRRAYFAHRTPGLLYLIIAQKNRLVNGQCIVAEC